MVISQTSAPQQYLSQYTGTGATPKPAGIPISTSESGYYLIVSKSAKTVDHVVVTRLGDHYSAESPPSFTINQGTTISPPLAVSLNTANYNQAYAPIFDLNGGYIINGNGQSLVKVVDGGSGYSAGMWISAMPAEAGGYKNGDSITWINDNPEGQSAKGTLNVDQKNNLTGITIINPGSVWLAEPTKYLINNSADPNTGSKLATFTTNMRNYPVVSIGAGRPGSTPATAYALVSPADTNNPDYDKGCIVTGIAFTNVGSGYVPAGSSKGVPPAITQAFIGALPTMTVSAPAQNPAGTPAIVDGQFAIASKWNAFWLDGVGSITSQRGLASAAPLESVGSTTVAKPGSGYGWDVQVTFSAPSTGNDIATGYAVLNPEGSINRIAITNPGSG
ncbi:MAG: hypothetical protein ACKOS8_13190, partial [Gemmataceae bacterium]